MLVVLLLVNNKYCIFSFILFSCLRLFVVVVEMSNHTPLFPSDSEIDQIHRIFRFKILLFVVEFFHDLNSIYRVLGTPSHSIWPEYLSLPFTRPNFPIWSRINSLSLLIPRLCSDGIELLEVKKLRFSFKWNFLSLTQTS